MDTQQTNKLPTGNSAITSAFWILNAFILAWNLLFNILDSLANILISIQKGSISTEDEIHINNMKNFVSNTFNSTSTPFINSTPFNNSSEDIIKEVVTPNIMEVSNTSANSDYCPSSLRLLNNESLQLDSTTTVITTAPLQLPDESISADTTSATAEERVDNRPPSNWSEASFDADEDSSSESDDDEEELHNSTSYSTSEPLPIPTMNSTASDSDSRSSTPPTTDDPQVVPSEKAKSKRRRRRGKRKSKAQKEAARLELEQAATASTDPSSTSTSTTPNSKQVKSPSKQNTPSSKNSQKKTFSSSSSTNQKNNKSKNQKNNLQTSTGNASNLIGKSDMITPPRRFSHSALRLKSDTDEVHNSNLDHLIKPIRQPFGPAIGNNFGFSSEYQKSRRLAIQRSKAN